MVSLSNFGIRVMVVSYNALGSIPYSEIFWNSFRRIGVNSSLNVCVCVFNNGSSLECTGQHCVQVILA